MSTLLKDIYSLVFYNNLADVLNELLPEFDKKQFTRLIFDKEWESKELKERMKHTSSVLNKFFPVDFAEAAELITTAIHLLRKKGIKEQTIEFMFFPDYIETYGINHYDISVKTIEQVTQFTSCEYAVRPFIIMYGDKMIKQMLRWSQHESHHVRRLASEGSRPRLPWAIALPELKKNPLPLLPILESLKQDSSEYVRRSVANSLNDIAKDNPHVVISIAKQWKGISKETDAIIKHGCRTLLKKGHPEILKYYKLSDKADIGISGFKIKNNNVKIGDYMNFSFSLQNREHTKQNLRLEYAIHFLLQNGMHYKKVFKISERILKPGEKLSFEKRHSFKIITTRKYYPGLHKLSVIVNGQELKTGKFELKKK
jgi:3-methyladenine DNA glycosylase AlkC